MLPSWITDPLWDQFHALLSERIDQHPLGCHRPRIGDRIVFDKLLQALVFGCGYQRVADHTCSERTPRRRRDEWITAGVADQLHRLAVAAYDRLIGLELDHLVVDGCITKAPCGGEVAGPSPVDRGKGGSKRSLVVEGEGIPLGVVPAAANRRDDGLRPSRSIPWTRLVRCPSGRPCTWTPATTTSLATRSLLAGVWPARLPRVGCLRLSRWAAGGWWNARMPG
jgi:transposase